MVGILLLMEFKSDHLLVFFCNSYRIRIATNDTHFKVYSIFLKIDNQIYFQTVSVCQKADRTFKLLVKIKEPLSFVLRFGFGQNAKKWSQIIENGMHQIPNSEKNNFNSRNYLNTIHCNSMEHLNSRNSWILARRCDVY